ncbi:MAG: hypothetical protein V4472_24970 [Pseudomonadota bacterium]
MDTVRCQTCGAPVTGDRCPYCRTARWPELADPIPEVKIDPDRVIVAVPEGVWLVPTGFILDRGLLASDVPKMAEREGWPRGPFCYSHDRFRIYSWPGDQSDADLRDCCRADLEYVASGSAR